MNKIVTIFGSSAPEDNSEEFTMAYECGRQLAIAGFTVCNGGYGGTMRASAMGAKQAGGKTIGVGVSSWSRKPNEWIEQEFTEATLVGRLMKLVELGDAYVVLPGGTGTLLELACVLELINKEIIGQKPVVMVGDFWNGVIETVERAPHPNGAVGSRRLVQNVRNPEELATYLKSVLVRQ